MTSEELIKEAAKAIARSRGDFLDGEQDRISARAALAVFEKAQCKRCWKLAEGYAFINGDRYCHPDDGVDCYTLANHGLTSLANQAFIEKAQAPTDEERHWSDAAASAYPGDEYDNADLRTAFGRGVKWERRRPVQAEPTEAQVLAAMTDPNSITDEQADAAQLAHYRFVFGDEGLPNQRALGIGRQAMKVAISEAVRAAFTAGQEDKP